MLILRKKSSLEYFFKTVGRTERGRGDRGIRRPSVVKKASYSRARVEQEEVAGVSDKEVKKKISDMGKELSGSKSAALLDAGMSLIKKVNVTNLIPTMKKSRRKVHSIVMDGTVTSSVISVAEERGVKNIAAKNFAATSDQINMLTI